MARAKSVSPQTASIAEIGFEAKLWITADKLRNNMDAVGYKHVVLGLIFLKYISDTFEEHRARLVAGEGHCASANPEDADEYLAENVFWVPKEGRWFHPQANAKQPTIGKLVDNVIATIELTAASAGEKTHPSFDLLGRVYEYFLTRFANAEGKNGGQFYTPSCIVRCPVGLFAPYKGRIDDLGCGSVGMIEVQNHDNEGRKRPQGPHQRIRAPNHSPLLKPAEIDGRSSAGRTTTPPRNLRRGELSGGPSRTKQSRVHCEIRRIRAGTERIREFAGTPRKWRDRARGQAASALCRVPQTHDDFRRHCQASTGRHLNAFLPSFNLQTLPCLTLRGIQADSGPEHSDTFHRDLTSPNSNLSNESPATEEPLLNDPDWFRSDDDVRWQFRAPPNKDNANFAWVQHFVHRLAPHGMLIKKLQGT